MGYKCIAYPLVCFVGFFVVVLSCNSVAERPVMVRWVIGSILHGGPIKQFLVLGNAPQLVCRGGSGFPLSLAKWYFMTPYNRKIKCVECVVK